MISPTQTPGSGDSLDPQKQPDAALIDDSSPNDLDYPSGYGSKPADALGNQRFQMAKWILVATVAFCIVSMGIATFVDDSKWGRFDHVMGLTLTPFQTLLGLAVGYYLADKRSQRAP